MTSSNTNDPGVPRRQFIKTTAALSAGLAFPNVLRAQSSSDDLNVAVLGTGRQGFILLGQILKMDGIRVQAVCDAWPYNGDRACRLCGKYKHQARCYTRLDDLLAQEKDLDGIIIATPDFMHHEHTVKCLNAGIHVYCEKEMSNDIEKARAMVKAADTTGKLLQIGHQRRSNPYYRHALKMIRDDVYGDLVSARGQWHQRKPVINAPAKLIEKHGLPAAELNAIGFETMHEFRNWRWFKKYAGGPMTDLGSHQVDIFIWFLGVPPSSVDARGNNHFAKKNAIENGASYVPECFDHTLAMYDFDAKQGPVTGFYQVDLRTSLGGFYEEFYGNKGSLTIAEDKERNRFMLEPTEDQPDWVDQSDMTLEPVRTPGKKLSKVDMDQLKANLNKKPHQLHMENFFDAIRGKTELTCDAHVGFETAVAVLKANESAETGRRIEFKPEDFKA